MSDLLFPALAGFAAGLVVSWLWRRGRVAVQAERLARAEIEAQRLQGELALRETALDEHRQRLASLEATLDGERRQASEKLELVTQAGEDLRNAFKVLAADVLRAGSEDFLQLATAHLERFRGEARGDLDQRRQGIEELVKPLREELGKVSAQVLDLERMRQEAYGRIHEQVTSLIDAQRDLRGSTDGLKNALRRPEVRGRWGEMQLRRVVELAGMVAHCDFTEQTSMDTEEGRQRPDMLVRLPGGKVVVVDAKAPLVEYLESVEAADEAGREEHLAKHARLIRDHVAKLAGKAYWEKLPTAPDFVVLFLPGEMFFAAALDRDLELLEWAAAQRVILATPTTLIALLKAVSYGWQQETIAENARSIAAMGKELYERIDVFLGHLSGIGTGLEKASKAFNNAVGSLESRVLPSTRRLNELHGNSLRELNEVKTVDTRLRRIAASEGGNTADDGATQPGQIAEGSPARSDEGRPAGDGGRSGQETL